MAQNLRDLSYKVRSTNIATIFHTWKMGTKINIYFLKPKTARWGWKIIQIWKIDDLVFILWSIRQRAFSSHHGHNNCFQSDHELQGLKSSTSPYANLANSTSNSIFKNRKNI